MQYFHHWRSYNYYAKRIDPELFYPAQGIELKTREVYISADPPMEGMQTANPRMKKFGELSAGINLLRKLANSQVRAGFSRIVRAALNGRALRRESDYVRMRHMIYRLVKLRSTLRLPYLLRWRRAANQARLRLQRYQVRPCC